jgi:hypothetical protein
MSSGIVPPGTAGTTGSGLPPTGSPRQAASIVSSIRSVRLPRPAKLTPVATKSSSRPPTAIPRVSLPPEIDASVAASLAINTGLRRGSSRTLVSSSIRSVTAAAAANEMSES